MPEHYLANDVPTKAFPQVQPQIPAQRAARGPGYGWPDAPVIVPRRRRRWPWVVLAVPAVLAVLAVLVVFGLATGGRGATPTAAAPAPSAIPSTAPAVAPPAAAAPAASAAPAGPATSMEDGTYQVGVDVAAGRNTTIGPDASDVIPSCYWERASDDSGEFGSIIANENLSGPGSVTVKKGEVVKLSGSCTWTKQ